MEPLTAFSLAAGVLQVIDFSFRAIKTCREIHKDGSIAEHRETMEIANLLVSTLHSPDDLEILELSKKCSRVAKGLVSELNKLNLDDRGLFQVITRSVQTIRRKKYLDEQRDLLERYQSALDSRILKRLDARLLKQICDIHQLDQRVQDLVSAVEKGQRTFAELMTKESRGIKDHFDKKFDSHVRTTGEQYTYDRLRESLYFPEIMSRQEQVPTAFEGTCSWIFDTSADQRSRYRPWSNFRNWLENAKGVYWISGKPGSGKSTLMKYIVNADLTAQLLSDWEEDTDLLVVSFFFWEAGSVLQKSCTGLLRSLLFQIATKWPELVNLAGAQHGNARGIEVSNKLLPAWTDERLLSIFADFLERKPTSISLCAFVDGLDEYSGDEEVLLDVIRLFINTPQCKLCASSRPEQVFRQEFKPCPKLRVQDLNREDIKRTVVGRLTPTLRNHMQTDSWELNCLIDALVEKAQGVFLWLDLMIRDLITGARNHDTGTMLQSRLERAPDTINGMYTHILSSLDPIYQKESFKYFGTLLVADESSIQLNILDVVCAEGEALEHVVKYDLDYFETPQFHSHVRNAETRLIACCGGLIDIQTQLKDEDEDEIADIRIHRKTRVDFMHRTAREYVRARHKEDLLHPSSLAKVYTDLARGVIGVVASSPLASTRDEVLSNLASQVGKAISLLSLMTSRCLTLAVVDPSVSIQLDLINQFFQSLQSAYSFLYGLEQDFASDTKFLLRIVLGIGCIHELDIGRVHELDIDPTPWSSWCAMNDRLSVAAFFGWNHYVQSQLPSHDVAEDRAESLLQSALAGFEHSSLPATERDRFYHINSVTVHTVVQHSVNVEKRYSPKPISCNAPRHATFWGMLFKFLTEIHHMHHDKFASDPIWQASESYSSELVECFLSLGANPNSRIVHSGFIYPIYTDLVETIYEESPIAMLERLTRNHTQFLSQLKARLVSAGAVHRRCLLFIRSISSDSYYSSDCLSDDLLEQANNGFWESPTGIDGEGLHEILTAITAEKPMSEKDAISKIENSSLSF
ncbi:MAG: hypothetical protein Q9216_003007 [Gyalolechia sp. 2 TL-2023]